MMTPNAGMPTRPIDRQPLPIWPLTLVIVRSDGITRRELPRNGALQIGRDAGAEIQLDDEGVSRYHAKIEISDRVRVVDLGSRNGTRVGGRRLRPQEPVELCHEETVEVGGCVMIVHVRGVEPTNLSAYGSSMTSAAMLRVRTLCDHAAESDHGVLLVGESGVGKTRLAQMIHAFSRRRGGPFEIVDCSASRPEELELRLFGADDVAGALELVRGGTLVLRHVGGMPLDLQARLIAALDAGEVTRRGRARARPIDARIVATSRDPVGVLLQSGQVRRELMFRLSRIAIEVPPLRARGAEISALVIDAVRRHALAQGRPPPRASTGTLAAAEDYHWPGNLRELDARIAQAVVECDTDALQPEHLALGVSDAVASAPAGDGDERRAILDALLRCAGNQSQAAKLLGISRRTLVTRLELYRIPRPRDRPT